MRMTNITKNERIHRLRSCIKIKKMKKFNRINKKLIFNVL
jgi:hypothetical protein